MKKITLLFFMVLSSLSAFAQLPLESFEGSFPPAGWGIYDNAIGTNVSWAQSNGSAAQPAHTGTYAAYLNRENVPSGLPEDWLVTPQFQIPANAQLKFWSRLTQGGDQGSIYQVRVSVNAAQAAMGNYTIVQQWTENEINPSQLEYAPVTVDIPTSVAAVGSQAYIAFVMLGDNGDRWLVDDVQVVTKCLDPTNLTASNFGLDSATLSWGNPSVATSWQVEIVLAAGAAVGNYVTVNNPTPTYTPTGLQPDTDYKYYVRAVCSTGNESAWVGPFAFSTVAPGATCQAPKPIASLPYSTTDNTSNYGDDIEGTPGTSGCGTTGSFLNGDEVFYSYTAAFTGNISISMTGNGANSGMFVYTSCANIGTSCAAGGTGSATTPVNIPNFAVTAGQTYYIAIATSGTTQSTPYTLIVQQVACAQPVGQATANITSSSASLNWTNPSGATSWQVVVQPGGQGIPQGAGTTVTTNANYPANGLNPATLYEYWVRADCGNGTFSAWAGPYTFTTTQVPGTMNYTDDFEGTIGWTLNNGTQVNKWVVGTATSNSPTHSLYISNDNGVTNAYTGTTTAVVQAYRDIQLPANTGQISVQFDWKCVGESTFDYVRVWMVPTTYNPTAGTQITAGTGRVQLGGNLNQNANWTTTTYTTDATAYAGQVRRLVFEWRNDNIVANQPPAAIDNINVAVVTCPAPTALTATTPTSSGAMLGWTAPSGVTPTYDYYISTTNTAPVAATTPTGNVATVGTTLNTLNPATTYYVWVRSNCGSGDTSFWTGPATFTTLQIPATLNFTDNFEGPAVGWTLNNGTQANKWFYGTVVSNSPTHSLYVSNDNGVSNNYANTTSVVHAYRDITIPAGTTAQAELYFDWKAVGESTFDYLRVWVVPGTFNPTAGTQITTGTNRTQIGGNYNQNANWTTTNAVVNLAPYAGGVLRLVFEWRNDGIISNQPPAAIDNVNLAIPTCPRPTALAVSGVTQTDANFTWTEMSDATSWEVLVLPAGSPAPTASTSGTVVNTTPSYSATGLTQGTQYVFYVRANCGATDGYSTWAGPLSFTTKIANDECANAIEVPVNPNITCTQTVHGTVAGATQSTQATTCAGTRDDDVWFTFVATATTQAISLDNITGSTTDLYHVVYKGENCGSLTQLYCSDPNTSSANNFIVGQRYYIRIYTYTGTANQTSAFDVCVKTPPPPIAVSTTQYTVPQLVTDVLLKSSTCALVSNFTSSTGTNFGKANGIGYFTRNGSNFGATPTDPDFYHDGIILVTGDATQAPGYNTTVIGETTTTGWAGDASLEAIIPGYTPGDSNDATYIAFDFTPLVNQISFDFIFASEEYTPAFECDYSDSFAFILKDLTTNVSTNLAVIPSTTTPIQVTNITSATSSCPSNSQYFGGYSNTGFDPTNFNGYTQSMTAQSAVIPGHAYNIKLVVVDDRDNAYNSAVFLRGGSFDPGHVDLGADLLVSNNSAVCSGGTVTINSQLNPANYDFTWSNSQGVIPGETGPTLTVTVPGIYTLSAALENSLCAATDQILVEFFPPVADALGQPQNLTFCDASGTATFNLAQNTPVVLGSLNPSDYQVSYHASQADADAGINPLPLTYTNTTPFQQTVYVRVKNIATQCVGTKSFNLVVQDLTPQFTLPAPFSICDGTSGTISVTAGNFDPAAPGITYTWTHGTQTLADTTPSISVTQAGTYQVTVNNSGCTATQTVAVTVTAIPVPDNPADVTACDSYVLPALGVGNYYTAANGGGTMMNAGDVINTTTTLYVYAQSGTTPNCTAEQDFLITIVPSPVVTTPGNQVACNSYTLPAITVGNYYTGMGGTGTMMNVGDVLTTSQTVYVYAQSGTTPNCTDEESFTVTVVPTPVPDDPADVTSCDSYILPVLGTGNYYTGSGGTGTMLNAGDTVSTSQTLYVYAASGTTPNCVLENAFDITIVPSPVVVTPGNQVSCNSYTLPALSVGNYYTGMGGSGTMMNAGDVLNTSQTVYIYAQSGTTPNCTDEESFTVTIVTSPVPDDPADVTSCDSYVLPSLATGNYYTGTGGTGTMLNAGDVINATQTLYVYATGVVPGCTSENAFDITIVPSPVVTTPGNQVSCNSYTLPALPAGNYYTGMGGTGTMMNAGDVLTSSQTVYVYAQTGTTPNCTNEDSFTVTIVAPPVPDDPADVTSCDSYVLPALVTGNYYTGTGGTGTMLNAGDMISTTQTLYVYAPGAAPGCNSENSFDITIVPTPVLTNPGNQIACNSYMLPALSAGNYYTGMGGTGTMMNAGDMLTTSQTVYIYAQSGTSPNCTAEVSFTVTINNPPVVDAPAPVTQCDSYVLPALTSGTYYTGPGATGTMLAAGAVINTSQILYVYGVNAGCSAENSFLVTIVPTPVVTAPADVTECNSYTLPALASGNYYTAPNGGGTMLAAGSTVTSTQTIYVYAQSGSTPNCTAEDSFLVTINYTPVIDNPADVAACTSYTLPVLGSGSYYTGSGATGTPLAPGAVISSSQTIYVYGITGSCVAENSFDVTIIPLPVVSATNGCEGTEYALQAQFDDAIYHEDNVDIAWRDPNNNLIGTGTRVVITTPGTYHLIVTPAGYPTACPVDVPVPVASTACMIQKGISPGGSDDKNNSFDLTGFGVSHISIFNRYGKEVFSMGNYTNEWHGQESNGNDLPTGTYFYSIERNTGENVTGWIYINREQ